MCFVAQLRVILAQRQLPGYFVCFSSDSNNIFCNLGRKSALRLVITAAGGGGGTGHATGKLALDAHPVTSTQPSNSIAVITLICASLIDVLSLSCSPFSCIGLFLFPVFFAQFCGRICCCLLLFGFFELPRAVAGVVAVIPGGRCVDDDGAQVELGFCCDVHATRPNLLR